MTQIWTQARSNRGPLDVKLPAFTASRGTARTSGRRYRSDVLAIECHHNRRGWLHGRRRSGDQRAVVLSRWSGSSEGWNGLCRRYRQPPHPSRGVDGKISTIAGNGTSGFSGDDGPASSAQLYYPRGVVVAGDGTLYIADTYNNRIRRVGVDGKISTVAGNGTSGFSGDGGPASSAQLSSPSGVAVAGDGTLYIADTYNSRLRRVGVDGKISTVAGNGTSDFSGDGGPAVTGHNIYPSSEPMFSQ